MDILTGIQNVLMYINNNWTAIVIILGLIVAIVKKAKNFFGKTKDEKVEIAKKQISEIILKLVTDAETDYSEWAKSGAIKRSQVINKIFELYPVLSKVVDQDKIVAWIDSVIDKALQTMKEVLEKQADSELPYDETEDMSATEL